MISNDRETAYYQVIERRFPSVDGYPSVVEVYRRPVGKRFASTPEQARKDLLRRWRVGGARGIVERPDGSIERDEYVGVGELDGTRGRVWWEPLGAATRAFTENTVKPGDKITTVDGSRFIVAEVFPGVVSARRESGPVCAQVLYADIQLLLGCREDVEPAH